jgi:hypothetical protein
MTTEVKEDIPTFCPYLKEGNWTYEKCENELEGGCWFLNFTDDYKTIYCMYDTGET